MFFLFFFWTRFCSLRFSYSTATTKARTFFLLFFSMSFPYLLFGFVFLAFGVWSHTTGILIFFLLLFAWRSQGHTENRLSFLFLLFIILRSGFGS
ncbi:hypothetical protein HDV63DRAFT_362653, partial [Trichoderma sp. SZMC 28014]